MKRIIIFLLLMIMVLPLCASDILPVIPDGEVIRYKTIHGRKNKRIEYSSQSVFLKTDKGRKYYQIRTTTPYMQSETRMTADSFIPYSLQEHFFGGRGEVDRTTTLRTIPAEEDNEIVVLSTEDFAHVLRAYPFENPRDMNVLFPGQEGNGQNSGMVFRIIYVGKDTVNLEGQSYDAWKLELKADFSGGMAILSGLIPKTYFWFSRDASRHLLKMTGSEGPGADEAITLEMISYTP